MLSLNEKAAHSVTYFEALQANPDNTKQFAIEKLGYSKGEAEEVVKVWCDCFVELSNVMEWDQIVELSQETITEEEIAKSQKQDTTKSIVKQFMSDWDKEYKAIKRVQKLQEDLDWVYKTEKPYERIANSLKLWKQKHTDAFQVIKDKVVKGLYTESTLDKAIELHGKNDLGYVIDCFMDMLEEA